MHHGASLRNENFRHFSLYPSPEARDARYSVFKYAMIASTSAALSRVLPT